MRKIFELKTKRIFTIAEARELLPLVYRMTEEANRELRNLMNQLKALGSAYNPKASELEKRVNLLVEKWNSKMIRLGGKPKGVWLADFDNGQGFFCWKFPETDILHTHGYSEGFTGRRVIGDQDHASSISPN